MIIKENFHTHTSRCGHAYGNDEDFVKAALEIKLETLGFSDHVFLKGVIQPRTRGSFDELEGYISSINYLKKKYENKINILLGFECEYCKKFLNYYKSLLLVNEFDYLILGQHFDFDQEEVKYIRKYAGDPLVLSRYADQLEEGVKTGLFLYVAHPDLYVIGNTVFDETCVEVAHKICKMAEKYQIPLELNAHAYTSWESKRGCLVYPCDDFWKIASLYDIEVVVGYDSHRPEEFKEDLSFIERIINENNLKLADMKKHYKNYRERIKSI